jgi:Protein of unknown function (DUF3800)
MAVFASAHRERPDAKLVSDIYCDESSQTKNKFLVIGGIILPSTAVRSANACIAAARLPQLPRGEMKWGKVSQYKLAAYGRVAKCFFDSDEFKEAHFHCLIVPMHELDHKTYNQGSREIGFNKEIYQLASKFARLYRDRLFHFYPDQRDTQSTPEELRTILNFGRRKAGDPRDWPFRRCQFRDSKKTPLLQMVDIMIGAIGYCVNEHAKADGASLAKARLSAYIMKRAGVTDCSIDTTKSGKFTIWHRQLKPRGGVPRD